jgi:hypothetical protein
MVKKSTKIATQHIKYGRDQVAEHTPGHRRYRSSEIARYERLIRELSELLLYLKRHDGRARPASLGWSQNRQESESVASAACNATHSPALKLTTQQDRYDLSDLPPELLEELSDEARREVGHQLIEIIDGRGGTATLDEILIDLYRKYKKVGKRANVAKRLLFLSRRGLCGLVPGANGYYTTAQPDRYELEDNKENRQSCGTQQDSGAKAKL